LKPITWINKENNIKKGTKEMNTDWFKTKLKEKKATQNDLARFLKMDKAGVSHLISGRRRMNIDEIEPLADFFNVNPNVIYEISKRNKVIKPLYDGVFLNRHEMVKKLIAQDIVKITDELQKGEIGHIYHILMSGIPYDKKTLREIIDEYTYKEVLEKTQK
jgi:transcriptional regulator with XRE-family HTH domain